MGQPAPTETSGDHRVTVERYFGLVTEGVLDADDRVELLDGVIVAMAPEKPGHAGTIHRVARALRRAVGERADVREDKSLGYTITVIITAIVIFVVIGAVSGAVVRTDGPTMR